MSESEKNEYCTMENPDVCSESLEQSKILNNCTVSSMDESQDFHLVDFDDEESLVKSQQNAEDTKPEEDSSPCSTDKIEEMTSKTEGTIVVDKAIHSDKEKDNLVEQEDAQKTESVEEKMPEDVGNLEKKDKHSDEEEEIIQCTPPEIYSPSKKQASGNVTNLKRKAESFDEPPRKVLRTSSEENIPEGSELEKEESCRPFKSDDSSQEFPKNYTDKSIIIAETQEVVEDESVGGTFEKSMKDEEEAEAEKRPVPQIKDYEMDKNENFNDTAKMSETITSKEYTEETCDVKNVAQSNENKSLQVQTKEKDGTSPSRLTDKIRSDTNNKSTDSTKSIEDKDTKMVYNEKTEDKENGMESTKHVNSEQKNNEAQETLTSKKVSNESHSNISNANVCKSRNSIELVYDRSSVHEIKSKSKEIVEIDEDGEKIVLDSSQDDSDLKTEDKNILDNTKAETVYKSCYDTKSSSEFSYKSIESTKESSIDSSKSSSKLVNGSGESKRCDTDSTASLQSDTFSDIPILLDKADSQISTSVHNLSKQNKPLVSSVSKDNDHTDLLSVSDNEPEVYIVDDKSKSNLTHSNSMTKALQVEKEIGMYVRMKCLLHVDEGTKEFLSKEITGIQCESIAEPTLSRQKNNDTSASLADISGNDNKDASPGSINSNPQMYVLNPSRLSFVSTVSSLSSVSSAASLAAKLAMRDSTHFSLPRAPAKHAKKHVQDMHSLNDKPAVDEAYDRLTKEWQNSHLIATTILNFANTELSGVDSYNVSNERIDDHLQKIRSSTPEVPREVVEEQTPKSTKKSKTAKRTRSKSIKSDNQSNGLNKVSLKVLSPTENNGTPNRKKSKMEHADDTLSSVDLSLKPLSQAVADDLIGKDVFAKWSDNNYYPGTVTDKIKTKYKVNFYDGKSKVLIEDFVITIPKVLKEGLSVYATTATDGYGSCGIIVDVETVNNEVHYIVETDEGERLQVQVKDIFLSSDQAQLLKEELTADSNSLPSTPKHLGQVTLDNVVDGKRRSKRIATPGFSTPKTKLLQTPTSKNVAEPSVSGVTSAVKKEKKLLSDSDGTSSDSNVSVKVETSIGVQSEIIGTPFEQVVKGPQSRIKSKSRNKKKTEDEETIATFGPIPHAGSNLFKGMSFILTCASLETIDRYQVDNKDYSSDAGTENEEEWVKKPFVRDRLKKQIEAGGGKVYEDFNEIPQEEYKSTKLITNVPNTTAKTLLCLSVGIPAYNHNWIIRCCQEGKIVRPAEDELPAGWSIDKQSYVEMFQRSSNKQFTEVVIIIPVVESERQFITFWRQVCENAGAIVLLADKPDAMEGFVEGTVVLTNRSCPSWAVERATEFQIPLLSTTWLTQCLIEGKLCPYDSHPRYKYNYVQN